MKKVKNLLTTSAAAAAIALTATPAMAGIEASAAVSSKYLFRGIDQNAGDAAVSGDLVYSIGGAYIGTWVSSSAGSEEVNVFAGWSAELGGLGIDIGALTYYYPTNTAYDTFGELSEAYLGLSFAGLELYYWDNVAGVSSAKNAASFGTYGDEGYVYYTLSYSVGQFSALVGVADPEEVTGQTFDDDYTHLDLTYAYNDNLSFTLSKVIDVDDERNANVTAVPGPNPNTIDDDTQFVVTYSIPLN